MRTRIRDEQFTEFFRAESSRLERFATMLVRDPVRGAELAQEALARVYAHWGRIKDGSPAAYARQIVVNLVRTEYRADRLRALKPLPAWASDHRTAPGAGEGLGDAMALSEALGRLSPIRRAAVLLRFYEDMPEAEIASLLDRPLGTVKSDIHRALRQLRPLLEETHTGGVRHDTRR